VSVCSGHYESFKAKVRYQQKTLDVGNKKKNVGIEVKIVSLKVYDSYLAYHEIFTWCLR